MQRRSFVATATAGLAGLAGCAGVLSGSDGSNGDGPDDAARRFFEAAFDGDVEEANASLHSDAEIGPFDREDVEGLENADARVESVEVVEQSGDTATVRVTATAQRSGGSGRESDTVRLELRREDGEWRVYADTTADDGPAAPDARWEHNSRTDDGNVTAVTFTHGGGDTIPSGTLSARVDDSTAFAPPGTDVDVATTVVVPLDGRGDTLPDSTTVSLVWNAPDTDHTQELESYVLPLSSVGTLGEALRIE